MGAAKILAVPALAGAVLVGTATAAFAGPAGGSAAYNVWEHGGSNLGECSAYLGQLAVPGVTNVRAEVNHVIQQYGDVLGIASPGALYSVRAQQQVNLQPAQECMPRQLPGGGTG
jgi:hypothetical protein